MYLPQLVFRIIFAVCSFWFGYNLAGMGFILTIVIDVAFDLFYPRLHRSYLQEMQMYNDRNQNVWFRITFPFFRSHQRWKAAQPLQLTWVIYKITWLSSAALILWDLRWLLEAATLTF